MKSTITNLIAVAALLVSGAAIAAGEPESNAQPPAVQPPVTQPAAASSVQPASAPASTEAASAQESQPAMKRSTSGKHATTVRPKNLDLRHCLDLESNAAIAKCAGE